MNNFLSSQDIIIIIRTHCNSAEINGSMTIMIIVSFVNLNNSFRLINMESSLLDLGEFNSLPTIRNSLRKQNPVLKYNA